MITSPRASAGPRDGARTRPHNRSSPRCNIVCWRVRLPRVRRGRRSMRSFVILLALVAAGCNRSEAGPQTQTRVEDPARALSTIEVQERALPKELVLTGSLVANRQSDLAANAAGRVLETTVERGQ